MRENLAEALSYIFVFEGGFAVRDTEPGGSVNMGVSQVTLAAWRTSHGDSVPTVDDVRTLSKAEAEAIYASLYADKVWFDDLPSGLDFCVLDAGVNSGIGWTRGELMSLAGLSAEAKQSPTEAHDGIMAWARSVETADAIGRFSDARLSHMQTNPSWSRFHRGWEARVNSVREHALAMAGRTA